MSFWNQATHYLLPDLDSHEPDIHELKHRRLFVQFASTSTMVFLVFSIRDFLQGYYISGVNVLSGFIFCLASIISYRFTKKYLASVYLFILSLIVICFVQLVTTPDRILGTLAWAPLILLVGGFLVGRKHAFILAFIVGLLLCIGLMVKESHLFVTDNIANPILQTQVNSILNILSTLVVVLIMMSEEEKIHNALISQMNNSIDQTQEYAALLSLLSHDLTNAVFRIKGQGDMIKERYIQGEKVDLKGVLTCTEKILKSSDTAFGILDQVKQMRSFESGKKGMDIVALDPQKQFKEAIEVYKEKIEAKNLSLNWRIEEGLPAFWGEPYIFQTSILGNLITNAIKFSYEGGEIELGAMDTGGDDLVFWVKDYGVGIPVDIKASLFSNLIPTSRKGTAGEESSGLGLPIVKHLVEKFDGRIWAESTIHPKEHHSIFYFTVKKASISRDQILKDAA